MGALDWLTRKLNAKLPETAHSPPLQTGVTTFTQNSLQFLGQQEGLGAELLEAGFRGALLQLPVVSRAYFCKVRYGSENVNRAGVCVVGAKGSEPKVVEALAPVIKRHLDQDYTIDILFLSERQEAEIAKTCEPFYNAI